MQDRLRRLDALFARRVLGHGTLKMPVKSAETEEWSDELFIAGSGLVMLPRYTRSFDAAREGESRFRLIVRHAKEAEGGVHATAYVEFRPVVGHGSASHPAEALVLACLRAVGCTEEEIA